MEQERCGCLGSAPLASSPQTRCIAQGRSSRPLCGRRHLCKQKARKYPSDDVETPLRTSMRDDHTLFYEMSQLTSPRRWDMNTPRLLVIAQRGTPASLVFSRHL